MSRTTCNAAVFTGVGEPMVIQQFILPQKIEPGAALCKIRMSTICGSDLHTVSGRRQEPTPLILGHEIIGEVIALGEGLDKDGFGNELNVGDRVTWSVMAACGDCFHCNNKIPQKCENLHKYGHMSCTQPPYLTGGFAEYIYLFPGTAIFKIPENVSDAVAVPANCTLSTAINAVETIDLIKGEKVLIQGAGLLGIYLVSVVADIGAKKIIVTDVNQNRLNLATTFGASCCLNVEKLADEKILSAIHKETDGYGVDVAFEVCGDPTVVNQAIDALRIGGRYLLAGMVTPGNDLIIDGNLVTRRCLTIKGIHNYRFDHLGRAVKFLEKANNKVLFKELVGRIFPLEQINEAYQTARSGEYIRVAIQ
jgi:alcohol dehydrogenase